MTFLIFLALIVGCIFMVKGCNYVKQHGLKGAVSTVWEGPGHTNSTPVKVDF